MRATVHLLSLTLIVTFGLGACRPPQDAGARANAASVNLRIVTPDEPVVGPVTVTVRLDQGGEPVSGAEVEVTGDMTHAGMAPVVRTATEHEPGSYRTHDFTFTMAGDWVLSAVATLPDGGTVRGEAATTVPSP